MVKTMIAQFISNTQRSWSNKLDEIAFTYTTAKHETTQFTPAYLNYGRELDFPATVRSRLEAEDTVEEPYGIQHRVNQLQEAYEIVRLNLAKAFTKHCTYYNKRRREWVPKVGDIVAKREYLLSSAVGQFSAKLAAKYTGNYRIIERLSQVMFTIEGEAGDIHRPHIKNLNLCFRSEPPEVDEISF